MDPDMAPLVLTNETPSNNVMERARVYLSKEEKEIEKLDLQIQLLKMGLGSAESQRKSSEDLAGLYRTILSPIRRLPQDVLREIFVRTLPTTRNPVMSSREPPLLLTHICSTWRTVALSSPRIWARLYIPFPGNERYMRYDEEDIREYPGYNEAMVRRCTIVQEWLSRSGDCPLSLSLRYPHTLNPADQEIGRQTSDLLRAVLLHVGHWRELEFSGPGFVYDELQAGFRVQEASCLEIIRLKLDDDMGSFNETAQHIPLLSAPKLRHVAIHSEDFTTRFLQAPLAGPAPRWENMSSIALHSTIRDTDVADILTLMPNAVHCSLAVARTQGAGTTALPMDPDPEFDLSRKEAIHLPRLETLRIQDFGAPALMDASLGRVDAPSLKRLDYYRYTMFHIPDPDGHPAFETRACPFTPLLERCAPTLRTLAWFPPGASNPIACLQMAENVRRLILGHRPSLRGGRQKSHSSVDFDYTPILACLVVPEGMEGIQSELAAGPDDRVPSVFLPHLQVLEVHQIENVTDEFVLHLIRSRLHHFTRPHRSENSHPSTIPSAQSSDSTLRNGIALLRKVVIGFDRKMQVDIKPEVEKLAKEAGVTFQLELWYPPEIPHSRSRNPLSTSSGVAQDNTTWPHPDLPQVESF